MDKRVLRERFIEQREQIPETEARAASEAIASALFDADFYRDAKSLFIYISVNKEPATAAVIKDAFAAGKTVCVPRTSPGRLLEAVPLENESVFLRAFRDWPRSFSIPEPPERCPATDDASLDLVIVPSLAADRYGYRLGYGGGYYDAFLAHCANRSRRPLFAAIQYSAFILDEALPREPYDMPVDLIITENGIIAPV